MQTWSCTFCLPSWIWNAQCVADMVMIICYILDALCSWKEDMKTSSVSILVFLEANRNLWLDIFCSIWKFFAHDSAPTTRKRTTKTKTKLLLGPLSVARGQKVAIDFVFTNHYIRSYELFSNRITISNCHIWRWIWYS